jgi:hypothetical protein
MRARWCCRYFASGCARRDMGAALSHAVARVGIRGGVVPVSTAWLQLSRIVSRIAFQSFTDSGLALPDLWAGVAPADLRTAWATGSPDSSAAASASWSRPRTTADCETPPLRPTDRIRANRSACS